MNVLVLGSGGREHALAWKLAESPLCDKVYIAPGNAGTKNVGVNLPVDLDDFYSIGKMVIEYDIGIVVVGPEAPLVGGIRDYFLKRKELSAIPVIGPGQQAAMLEGSKDFAKTFMHKYQIPTAASATFQKENFEEGLTYLESLKPPYVLKADGLAAGKGVLIIDDLEQAKNELAKMINESKFGEASAKVVIEEFLEGIELSVFVLTDGVHYKMLPEAKDYKRIGEGDTGLNTGGMGSVSPVPFANKEFLDKIERKIVQPTIEGLINEGLDYRGFIFFGLIRVGDEPYVIEYNCRMGDPEAESVIPRIKSDLLELFVAVGNQTLDTVEVEFENQYAATIMIVSGGYPERYAKDKLITIPDNLTNCIVFHSGTTVDIETGMIKTSGGRVIAVTSYGRNMKEALENAYANSNHIDFKGKYYRKDIGFDLENRDDV
ncbi:MAG: phosphoribosylamine--glycine ligase [Bacteroidetes bacterium]|nr:MAG: phosphoribosylamine--glycine ligase [Bacteroidota bacterium]RLD49362.1 MAG: phosphoribosylamine--glycine ligase [Bacteroidota bacterium]